MKKIIKFEAETRYLNLFDSCSKLGSKLKIKNVLAEYQIWCLAINYYYQFLLLTWNMLCFVVIKFKK